MTQPDAVSTDASAAIAATSTKNEISNDASRKGKKFAEKQELILHQVAQLRNYG